jgi:hypothetical protein
MAITKEVKYTVTMGEDVSLDIELDTEGVQIYRWIDASLISSVEIEFDALDEVISVLTEIQKTRNANN